MKMSLRYTHLFQLVLVCMGFLAGQQMSGFCFAPQLKVSDEFFVSDLVLIGTVVRAQDIKTDPSDPDFTDGTYYTIQIDHSLRGKAGRLIRVYSENSTARYPMELRRKYVLFLNRNTEHQWTIDNCGNSSLLAKGRATMRQLRQLPLRHSFVYGDVFLFSGDPEAPCEPMLLTIRAGKFAKTTDVRSDCTFQVDVPSGHYSATLEWKGARILSNDLDYKDIYCFDVPRGGSAGLAFRDMTLADDGNRSSTARIDRGYESRCTTGKDLRGPIYIP